MAAPGIGYVKRDVDKTTIDWSAVSSSITGALGEAFTEAQKQRAEVELTDQKMAGEIQNLPKGATPDQSKYYASAIQNIGDANQKIKEQYENGDISATQYKIAVNSLNTQYQIFKNNAISYQDAYTKYKEKVLDENSGLVTNLFATTVDTMAGMNKSVNWNPETQMLESTYVVNGQTITTPVTNDLAMMSYENKKFNQKAITNADNSFAKKVFETVDVEGNVTYSANYKSKEFQDALQNYVSGLTSDANGIQALEYLGARNYELTLEAPTKDNQIQVRIDKSSGLPIATDVAAVKKLAQDGLKKDIIASLDTTYRTKEGGKQFELDFVPNKEITMGLVSGVKTVDDYVNHLDRFKPGTYLSKNEMAKSSQPFKVIVDGVEQVVSAAEYVKSRPEATFFEIDKQGRPRPVVLNTFEDFFSFANQAAGMNDKQISAFRKKEKGKKYFVENGEIKFDTPATIAEKRRQGIPLPNYIEGNIISQTTNTDKTSNLNIPISSAVGVMVDESLGQTIGTSDASFKEQQEQLRKLQMQALSEQQLKKGATTKTNISLVDEFGVPIQ